MFAFLSGLATVASPCVLPVLPVVLSTSVGAGRWRPLGVVIGLTGTFTVATLAGAAAAQVLALPTVWLRTVAIAALGLFGISMLLPSWGRALERWFSPLGRLTNSSAQRHGFTGDLLMGAGLGLLWSPCVGPIMGSVLALAVSSGVSAQLAWITLAYAAGCGLPMLAIGYGARGILARVKSIGPRSGVVRQTFGALTLLACLALLFGYDTRIQSIVPTVWSNTLTAFERQENVQKELDKLEIKAQTESDLAAAQASTQQLTVTPQPEPTGTPTPVPPTSVAAAPGLALSDLGPAPELVGLTDWINSEPLTLKSLRGKVVIVDFWTFGCYNCRNTRPYVRALYDKYHNQGLEILGIHTPEFAYEHALENVRGAAKEQGVTWPIALDPDYKTWRAFKNRYWPAFYFIDAQGHLRYTHFGEGNYEKNEQVVQQLLSEAGLTSN
jgi:cytochrome c biogenesis protein CcdA/thiol-disulfide isomerase/thioredoxin